MASALLSGCAGAQSSFKLPPSYGHQPDGSYVLSKWEYGQDCKRLGNAAQRRLNHMKNIVKAEQAARRGLPRTLMEAISWKNGNPTGYGKRFKRHRLQQTEAQGYFKAMRAKSCPQTAGLQQQIARMRMPGTGSNPLNRRADIAPATATIYKTASGPETSIPSGRYIPATPGGPSPNAAPDVRSENLQSLSAPVAPTQIRPAL